MTDQQQNLFETQPEPWQLDDLEDLLVARVVLSEAPYGPYDYRIPPELESAIRPGMRLVIPLGRSNRSLRGYCTEVFNVAHRTGPPIDVRRLKPVTRVIDRAPIIDPTLLSLADWISRYYICPMGTVIETIIPPGVRDGAGTREVVFLTLANELQGRLDELKTTPQQRAVLELLQTGGADWTARELA